MKLLVIGPQADAIARRIDAGAHAALDPGLTASPLSAAGETGTELDPRFLVELLRDADVASVEAGILAPLTPRYSVRDLALELGAPVLLSVAAGPHVVSDARLALDCARGAGLRVIDVVLTGDSDERELLSALADVPTVGVADEQPWPVEEWLAAPAADAPRRASAVSLDAYRAWPPRATDDPRTTPRPQIMAALLEIAGAEGPMLATRAFALYNRASGGKKLTTVVRTPLASALHWLGQERRIVVTGADDIPWQDDDLIRLPDAPAIHVRELGPRALDEVPLDEIAELMRRLDARDPKRAVLDAYGLRRLTAHADQYLGYAMDLAAG